MWQLPVWQRMYGDESAFSPVLICMKYSVFREKSDFFQKNY